MLDPKLIRSQLDDIAQKLAVRGFTLDTKTLQVLEEKRKTLQVETQSLQNERNIRSKSIGKAKAAGEDIAPLLKEVEVYGDKLTTCDRKNAKLTLGF